MALPPAASTPLAGDPLEFFDQVDDLFDLHRTAYANYRKAVADVAEHTGRSVSSVGHTFAAEKRRRTRAQRAGAEPFEAAAEEWCNLM